MKVANFTDTYLPHNNGVATTLYGVHHVEKGWEDSLFGPVDHPDVVRVSGVPFPVFPEYRLALNTGWLEERVKGFDVIHNHTPYGMFYYGAKMSKSLGLPLVGTFHTDPAAVFGALLATESFWGKPATRLTWGYLIKLYNRCDLVVAVSGWLERELKKRGLRKPIKTVPNGVDVTRFNPNINSDQFRKAYDIPKDRPLVLFLGRLQHKKDPTTLVRAAMQCKTDATFMISGHGELEEKLRHMARKHPNILFPGYLPKKFVNQAYAAADLFVFPSEMETQGIVLLEAMASGTPCLSTDVGIARDLLDDEYIIGFKDAGGFARRMDELLPDRHRLKKLGEHARKKVESDFSLEAMLRKLEDVYCELAKC